MVWRLGWDPGRCLQVLSSLLEVGGAYLTIEPLVLVFWNKVKPMNHNDDRT